MTERYSGPVLERLGAELRRGAEDFGPLDGSEAVAVFSGPESEGRTREGRKSLTDLWSGIGKDVANGVAGLDANVLLLPSVIPASAIRTVRTELYGDVDASINSFPAIAAAAAAAASLGYRVDGGGAIHGLTGKNNILSGLSSIALHDIRLVDLNPTVGGGTGDTKLLFSVQIANARLQGVVLDRAGDGTNGSLAYNVGMHLDSNNALVEECEVYGSNAGTCMLLKGDRLRVINNYLHDVYFNDSDGMGGTTATDDMVQGISVTLSANVSVIGNTIERFGRVAAQYPDIEGITWRCAMSRGIVLGSLNSGEVQGNFITDVGQAIDVTSGSGGAEFIDVIRNTITRSGENGIKVANTGVFCRIINNIITQPGWHGIAIEGHAANIQHITSRVQIRENLITDVGADGLVLAIGAATTRGIIIERNTASVPASESPFGCTVEDNEIISMADATTFTRTAADQFTLAGYLQIPNIGGVPVRLTTTGVLPAGLSTGRDYWAWTLDGFTNSVIRLSDTRDDGLDGIFVSTTTAGTGTHTITRQSKMSYGALASTTYVSAAKNVARNNRIEGALTEKVSGFQVLPAVNVVSFTTSDTYTPTPGMVYCDVEAVGGGGGGGGVGATAASGKAAPGGGAGEYAKSRLTAAQIGASKTVTIGAAGAASSAGDANGGDGGDTSLGSLVIAKGGKGSATVLGGTGGTGTILKPGMAGERGSGYQPAATAVLPKGGNGGDSPFGAGGLGASVGSGAAANGGAAVGYGAGGGGAAGLAIAATNVSGAAGTAGYMVITEYFVEAAIT